ncbi:hypothetical protein H6503_03780 [Candidatus Woesearchaeota archaeon]|nr:hypothetical protein [Candidatus Woesearchaeota archaeon]
MVDEALFDYINRQLKSGYSVQDVTNFLIQKGYDAAAIQECVNRIYSNPPADSQHKQHHNIGFIIIVLIFLAVIISVSFILFSIGDDESDNVVFNLDFSESEFNTGDPVTFTRILTADSGKGIPVRISYIIKDPSGDIVLTESEEILLLKEETEPLSFLVPVEDPGLYSIAATANYKGETVTRTASFRIISSEEIKVETCFDGIKNQAEEGIDCGGPCKACVRQCPIFIDDKNECTRDLCGPDTEYREVHEPIVPCCGNNICESSEDESSCSKDCNMQNQDNNDDYFEVTPNVEIISSELPLSEKIEKIREMSKTDQPQALRLCDGIVLDFYRDDCFYEVADETSDEDICGSIVEERTKDKCYTKISKNNEDSSLCGYVVSELRRDSCYMRFALKGDFTVCNKLLDEYYVQSCNQLAAVGKDSPEAIEKYSERID